MKEKINNVTYINKNIEEIKLSFLTKNSFDIIYHFAWDNYKDVKSEHHLSAELKKQKVFLKKLYKAILVKFLYLVVVLNMVLEKVNYLK